MRKLETELTTVHYTEQKTLNNFVKHYAQKQLPKVVKSVKQYVAGMGYVHYLVDANDKVLGKLYKGQTGMELMVNK